MDEKGVTIQDFLQIYQAANSQFDTLLVFIGTISTIFGIIVAIVIAFFAIRQINVDREIRKYRDEIKKQKELATEEVERIKVQLEGASILIAEAKETKNKLEEEIKKPASTETKKEIEKLQGKIEKLEEDITYKRGALSASPSSVMSGSAFMVSDSLYSASVAGWQEKCKKCGRTYQKSIGYHDTYAVLNSVVQEPQNINECPYCGNIN
ncbi:MAG: hypothetical protein WC880_02515 [Candidatus Paceibacterota bacterium]